VAALDILHRDPGGGSAETAALIDNELRSAIAFVLRAQLRPGPRHLFARPDDLRGGMPGRAVDLHLRIDYVQHAGSTTVGWLDRAP